MVSAQQPDYSLTVSVNGLRNSDGIVQFSLYDKEGTIPDENYKNYFLQLSHPIVNNGSTVTFNHLPKGQYAVNILHDENQDGKIQKGFLLPTEGIGFSNFDSIGFRNKPSFKKAQFLLNNNLDITIKILYF